MDHDLAALRAAYARGENITELLRSVTGSAENSPEIVEIAYDLQAGSYAAAAERAPEFLCAYTAEAAEWIERYFPGATSVLDAGCGELTTTTFLMQRLPRVTSWFGVDISWSRLRHGRLFAARHLSEEQQQRLTLSVAELGVLPLPDAAVDLVFTSHALEPNRGRERALLGELLRVARCGAVLLEPAYELTDEAQRRRMDQHGYVRDLPRQIAAAGGELLDVALLENYANPLNRTAAYVVGVAIRPEVGARLVDPVDQGPLQPVDQMLFAPRRGVAYPVVRELPILRPTKGIVATALAE